RTVPQPLGEGGGGGRSGGVGCERGGGVQRRRSGGGDRGCVGFIDAGLRKSFPALIAVSRAEPLSTVTDGTGDRVEAVLGGRRGGAGAGWGSDGRGLQPPHGQRPCRSSGHRRRSAERRGSVTVCRGEVSRQSGWITSVDG